MGEDSGVIKIGPVGTGGGDVWDEKGNFNIVRIFISHGEAIRSLQFQYIEKKRSKKKMKNGKLVLSKRHGTNSGDKFDIVKLNPPVEYITRISGHKRIGGHLCSLTVVTNVKEYGPFGSYTKWDPEFVFRLGDDGQFAGFHGSSDAYGVKSIGVYLKPTPNFSYCPVTSWILSQYCCFGSYGKEDDGHIETHSEGQN